MQIITYKSWCLKKKACEIKWDLPSMTCPAQHALKSELHKCKHKLQFITLELNKVFSR